MTAQAFYNYQKRSQPDLGGARDYVFIPGTQLPLYTLPGLGTPYSFRWNPAQPEQLYYNQAQVMDGIIGIVAGQMALQSLLNTQGVAGANG